MRVGEVTQLEEHLSGKYNALHSNPVPPKQREGGEGKRERKSFESLKNKFHWDWGCNSV
jgi:hypothetical protein